MIKRLIIGCLLLLSGPASAAAPLLADLSNYHITMDSTFNGTRLFVFGTRNTSGDVVVVVRGPTRNYVMHRKKEVGGIWINVDRIKFFNTPDFYAIASNKPVRDLKHQHILKELAIGHDYLFKAPFSGKKREIYEAFTTAFIAHQQGEKLYKYEETPLTFMGETLFKTVIEFPDNIPPGEYNAEIYLLQDGVIAGMHVLPITVKKVGLDAFLYDYAHHHSLLYGLSAIILALSAGWFAGRVFEKS
jgi:uncharacterized protein (TIGR02186 family)